MSSKIVSVKKLMFRKIHRVMIEISEERKKHSLIVQTSCPASFNFKLNFPAGYGLIA